MKKIMLFILLIFPVFIKAETYNEAINKANNYIFNFEEYNDYINLDDNMPYNYEDGENKINVKFTKGGFISKDEYLITNIKNNSYLSTGIEYWTLSQHSANKNYTIDIMLSNKKTDLNADVRVTQFVLNDAEVTGTGTKNDPWVFKEVFSTTIEPTNPERGDLSNDECSENNKKKKIVIKNFGESKSKFYICPEDGFEYNPDRSTCDEFVTAMSNNSFVLHSSPTQELVDNMICTIDFSYKTTKVTLKDGREQNANPYEIYLADNKDNWFYDSKGYNILRNIQPPTRTGYIFEGYYTGENGTGNQIIDKDGTIKTTNFYGTILYPKWIPITYYVKFDANGGSGSSISTIQCTYDLDCQLPANTFSKSNYYYMGWTKTKETASSNTGTGLDKIYAKDKGQIINLTSVHEQTATLYAKWLGCSDGTLKNDGSKGHICVKNRSSEDFSYACGEHACGSYSCNCTSCNCYNWCPDQTNNPGCLGGDTYCSTCCGTCTSYCTSYCTGTNYYCPSGWSNYTGSGSSLTCYKKASISN